MASVTSTAELRRAFHAAIGRAVVGQQQTIDGLLIIGASPVVNDNRSINNAGAGIKILNVLRQGHLSVEAAPLLTGNVATGNAQDGVVRGAYSL